MPTKSQVSSVKVRMYRHGFGDCFLLRFLAEAESVFTVLIDCGIKHNTRSEEVPIEDVISDLKSVLTAAGKRKPHIDVLVATHEHWDHISFFHPTRSPDFFADFDIGQVWLGWTEDPNDKEAVAINSRLRSGVAALQVAAAGLQEAEKAEAKQFSEMHFGSQVAAARGEFNRAMDDVLGFYGLNALSKVSQSGIKYKTNGNISVDTEEAMNHIVELGENGGGVRYFQPGDKVDSRSLPPGINIYVLGPPRSALINKSNPSPGQKKETYLSIDNSGMTSFVDGLLQMAAASEDGEQGAMSNTGPFTHGTGITPDEARRAPWFRKTYFSPAEKYRQIEHSWLDISGQFALQLDGAINNTSLVLAIELEDSGKVLLFPGDAQVGSWLSWHDLEWKVGKGQTSRTVTAESLLGNTVLYKVSHHGSHNATLRQKGLELMTHPELVAMIPEKEDSYDGIIHEQLMTRLLQLCKGRVIVSADKNYPAESLLAERPAGLTATEYRAFKKNLTVERVFVEYNVQ